MYIQGFIVPVQKDKQEAYRKAAADAGEYFAELGALEIVEAWEENVRDGKHTDFRMSVKAEPGEKIVFSWIIWPDKQTCDAAEKAMMEGGMEMPDEMPFDGKRMVFGGFTPLYTLGR